MPQTKPLSEFNRNQTSVIEDLVRTQEPLYLTRNGSQSVVVMDADAFDRAMATREDMRDQEMAVYTNLMRGYSEYQQGRTIASSEAFAAIRKDKGWS